MSGLYLFLFAVIFLSRDASSLAINLTHGDWFTLPPRDLEPIPQCDMIIRRSGYIVEDVLTAFGDDSVFLNCDANCKPPGATLALEWYKDNRKLPTPSTRRRVSSYYQSSSRVQTLLITHFRKSDVGRYTCKGWLGPYRGWVEKSISLQMGCAHPQILCDVFQCLPPEFRCDGVRQCEDGFDEKYCETTTKAITIDYNYDYDDNATNTTDCDDFQCDDGPCIAWDWVCDGIEDCPQADDEWNCWNTTAELPSTTPALEEKCPEDATKTGHYHHVFNDNCYLFVDEQKYWDEADQFCSDLGGQLLLIQNMETMDYIKQMLYSTELGWSNMGVWNGAKSLKGNWKWTSGEPLAFSYWSDGQPSEVFKDNCALMKKSDDWHWHVWGCRISGDWKYEFICQFDARRHQESTTSLPTTTPLGPENCYPNSQFRCWRSNYLHCIPLPWVCDGRQDCRQSEDEENCPTTISSTEHYVTSGVTTTSHSTSIWSSAPSSTESAISVCPGQFNCGNGICIALHKRCDSIPDCENEDDESNCIVDCNPNSRFRCWRSEYRYCIPKSWVCNGLQDCPLFEDEENCPPSISSSF